MRLGILGGAGFIGTNFVRYMVQHHPDVPISVYDAFTYAGHKESILLATQNTGISITTGRIEDREKLEDFIAENEITHIINFAACSHVDRSIAGDRNEFVETNVKGVLNILELVNKHNLQKYVQVSTDEVYGHLASPYDMSTDMGPEDYEEISNNKFTTSSPYDPRNVYAATKAAGDMLCKAYSNTWGTPVIVTHCTNNYGPFQHPEKMIPQWITKAQQGKNLPVYGDGMYVRDWIHVDDHCRGLWLALEKGAPGEEYLFGADNELPNLQIAGMINTMFERPYDAYTLVPDRPGHDRRYAIDYSETTKKLGWEPKYGRYEFKQKLKEVVEWYQLNKGWIQHVQEKNKA